MRLVGREKLDAFAAKHSDARSWLENWIADTELSKWKTPQRHQGQVFDRKFPGR